MRSIGCVLPRHASENITLSGEVKHRVARSFSVPSDEFCGNGYMMIVAEPDKSKSLLRVSYSGDVTVAEAHQAVMQLQSILAGLPRGLRLLTDLTQLERMDPACEPEIKRMMDLCNQHGVGRLVRVIPDPHKDIGFNIMSLFHYRHDLRIVTCETVAEAEQVLAG